MACVYWILILFAGLLTSFSGCSKESDPAGSYPANGGIVYTEDREPCSAFNPMRNVYFGETHAHTVISFDAWAWDVRSSLEDAYRFAQGESIALPPLDENGEGTRTVQIEQPLDFVAITDHAEFFAEVKACLTPGSAVYDSFTCALYRTGTSLGMSWLTTPLLYPSLGLPVEHREDICGPNGVDCLRCMESIGCGDN